MFQITQGLQLFQWNLQIVNNLYFGFDKFLKLILFLIQLWNQSSHLWSFCLILSYLLLFWKTLWAFGWLKTALLWWIVLCCFIMRQIMWYVRDYFVSLANAVRWEENVYWTVLSGAVERFLWGLIIKVNFMNFISNLPCNTVAFLRSRHLFLNYRSKRTFHQWNRLLIQLFSMIWLFFIMTLNNLKICLVIYNIFLKVIKINSYFWVFTLYFISRCPWLLRYSSTWIHLNKLRRAVW